MFEPVIPGVVESTKNTLLPTNPNLSRELNEVSAQLRKEYEAKKAELVYEVAIVYAKHFTEQELKELVDLLQEPARAEDAQGGTGRVGREPQARAGLVDRLLRDGDGALPHRNEEARSPVVMAASHDVDLFVIGAGSGGVRAARIAAGHGARVMIAEEFRIGGTCVIRGCVPKKLLVYASRFSHEFADAAGFGWTVGATSFDWPTLIANKDKEIARLEAAYRSNLEKAGVEIVKSRAVIEDGDTIRLLAFRGAGARRQYSHRHRWQPHPGHPIPGIEHAISSNEAFHLPALPEQHSSSRAAATSRWNSPASSPGSARR